MTNTKIVEVRQLLIEFSHLSARQKSLFLDTLNHFMFASPQRRQQIMREWQKIPASTATARTQVESTM
ncbi:hypothetical protein [Stenotrophomonas sp. Iso1]|uniref:hypothetical protein n=1 Tax=Stenotrophomonas sp. Iso1 TaxID=2977283 RepID=UPI0022B7C393|nr:hypothetical protein [Stenotrophomonas sp. Iso1]